MPTYDLVELVNLPNEKIFPKNPFKKEMLRKQYDAIINAFNIRHKDLIIKNKEGKYFQSRGNSWAHDFWIGYNNMKNRSHYAGIYDSSGYVCYRAGVNVRLAISKLNKS